MSEPSPPDIVAELDRWLRSGHLHSQEPVYQVMERARDEIMRLRRDCSALANWAVPAARAEALEEAARYFETQGVAPWYPEDAAAAIRALKNKP